MINLIIPASVFFLIFYFFGWKFFLWAVVFALFVGALALVWLFLEKDPSFIKYEKWAGNFWKKIKKEITFIFKDIFSIK